jgi:hypothetical protein
MSSGFLVRHRSGQPHDSQQQNGPILSAPVTLVHGLGTGGWPAPDVGCRQVPDRSTSQHFMRLILETPLELRRRVEDHCCDVTKHDYEVNLKAELEIMLLHEKIDLLRETQWDELLAIRSRRVRDRGKPGTYFQSVAGMRFSMTQTPSHAGTRSIKTVPVVPGRSPNSRSQPQSGRPSAQTIAAPTTGLKALRT